MSNYSLVVNSTFQPFTYQELTAPLDRQELYHERIADEYDKLSSQADVLEAMGANDRDKNSKTYLKYKNYSDNLRKEADNLYQNGLNYDTRQRLSNLRRMYNTDIVPIQNAWNKREQEADMQMKAYMQNPSLMFTRDARNSTLDEYIANPTGGFGVINGNNITAQMASMAKNLEKQIREGSARKEDIDPFTYRYIQENGLTPDMIREWRTNPTLSKMFEQVMRANGVTPEALNGSANAQNIIDQSTGYAEMGMWNAIGGTQSQILDNYKARQDYQFELNQRAAQNELQRKAALEAVKNGGADGMPNIPSVAVGLVPTDTYKAENLEVLNSLKGGKDALKARYFGNRFGDVNPLRIYDEYKQELNKRTGKNSKGYSADSYGGYHVGKLNVSNSNNEKAAREAVLSKYKKYGVTDILSDQQYQALTSLGYSAANPIKSYKHSNLLNKLNETVEQKSRYSTSMTDYSGFNDVVIPRLGLREGNGAGTVWAINDKGKLGEQESIKSLNLYSNTNKNGNKVTDVQYDPEFPGKIVIQLTDGKNKSSLHVIDPNVYNSNLTNMILEAEKYGAHPQAITAVIYDFLNKRNKVQGKTDSSIE